MMLWIYQFTSERSYKMSYFEGGKERGAEKGEHDDKQCYFYDDLTFFPVKIITKEAVWDMTDEDNPVLVTPEEKASGYWVVVSFEGSNPPRDNYVPWADVHALGRIDKEISGRSWPTT